MNDSLKEFVQKYRTLILACLVGILLVLCAGLGYSYGKNKICEDSGGVLAVTLDGEQCVQKYFIADNCAVPFEAQDLLIPAPYCKDASGLYPVKPLA